MKFLILDDEKKYQNLLKDKLESVFDECYIDIIDIFDDIKYRTTEYDAYFLDVMICNRESINYAANIKKYHPDAVIIFLSNYNELIFKAQRINPLYFIRKSHFDIDFTVFKSLYDELQSKKQKFHFTIDKTINKEKIDDIALSVNNIVYVECYNHKLIIHTFKNEYAVKLTFQEFLNKVAATKQIIQVHRSYAVNLNYIYYIYDNKIALLDGTSKNEVLMSRKYRKAFKDAFNEFVL